MYDIEVMAEDSEEACALVRNTVYDNNELPEEVVARECDVLQNDIQIRSVVRKA